MTKLHELIDIPGRVHQGDFVLKLTEGIQHAEQTLREYVVTPQLAGSFDAALGFIKSAVETGSSKAAYLHGSFGSGKSHFTSQPNRQHRIYPYLLKDVAIERPNQIWAADITYLPMARGFGYLMAIIDLFSRKVLAHRLSNTMTADFCVAAPQEALARFGTPEIFNTDQGAQFTDADFTDTLAAHGIAISMDGKGRWIDNVFVERLWRSVKYEDVYLRAYDSLAEARRGLVAYFEMYNGARPHQSLAYRTPDAVYFAALAAADRRAA